MMPLDTKAKTIIKQKLNNAHQVVTENKIFTLTNRLTEGVTKGNMHNFFQEELAYGWKLTELSQYTHD